MSIQIRGNTIINGNTIVNKDLPELSFSYFTASSNTSTISFDISGATANSILVLTLAQSNDSNFRDVTIVNPGFTWSERSRTSAINSGNTRIYTTELVNGGSIGLTATWAPGILSGVLYIISGQEDFHCGVGSSFTSQRSPSASITTTRERSYIFGVTSDRAAVDGSGRTYSNINTVETFYNFSSGVNTSYFFYNYAPSIQSYNIGLSYPTGQSSSTGLIEIRRKSRVLNLTGYFSTPGVFLGGASTFSITSQPLYSKRNTLGQFSNFDLLYLDQLGKRQLIDQSGQVKGVSTLQNVVPYRQVRNDAFGVPITAVGLVPPYFPHGYWVGSTSSAIVTSTTDRLWSSYDDVIPYFGVFTYAAESGTYFPSNFTIAWSAVPGTMSSHLITYDFFGNTTIRNISYLTPNNLVDIEFPIVGNWKKYRKGLWGPITGYQGEGKSNMYLPASQSGYIHHEVMISKNVFRTGLNFTLNNSISSPYYNAEYNVYVGTGSNYWYSYIGNTNGYSNSGIVAQDGDILRLKRVGATVSSDYYRNGSWNNIYSWTQSTTQQLWIVASTVNTDIATFLLNPKGFNILGP